MLCCELLRRRCDWAVQAHKLALRALRALNLKPILPDHRYKGSGISRGYMQTPC